MGQTNRTHRKVNSNDMVKVNKDADKNIMCLNKIFLGCDARGTSSPYIAEITIAIHGRMCQENVCTSLVHCF